MSRSDLKPSWFGMPGEPRPQLYSGIQRGQLVFDREDSAGADKISAITQAADGSMQLVPIVQGAWDLGDYLTEAESLAIFLTSAAADALFLTQAEADALFLTQAEGDDRYVQAQPFSQRALGRSYFGQVQANGNSTTFTSMGMGAITTAGTLSNADSTNQTSSTGLFGATVQTLTAAVIDSDASLVLAAPANALRINANPWFDGLFALGASASSTRVWIGFFGSSPIASADPTLHGFGFRFDTSVPDTGWMAWSNDNSAGGLATATGVGVIGNRHANLSAAVSGGGTQIDFYINDALVATHTTNLPSPTAYLGGGAYVRCLTASPRAVRLGRWAWGY